MVKTSDQLKNMVLDYVKLTGVTYRDTTTQTQQQYTDVEWQFLIGTALYITKLKSRDDRINFHYEIGISPQHKDGFQKIIEDEPDFINSLNELVILQDCSPRWVKEGNDITGLEISSYVDVEELNPRKILVYDTRSRKVEFIERKFFTIKPENDASRTKELLVRAIKKRIPDKKVGLLFSGGVDSTFIAVVLKELGVDFTCYTAAFEEKGMKKAGKKEGALKAVWEDLMTFFRLLSAWYKGRYKEIPWNAILLIIAAVLYLLMPLDLIPDVIPVAGFVDDVSVIMWVVLQIHDDLENFRKWEKQQEATA